MIIVIMIVSRTADKLLQGLYSIIMQRNVTGSRLGSTAADVCHTGLSSTGQALEVIRDTF